MNEFSNQGTHTDDNEMGSIVAAGDFYTDDSVTTTACDSVCQLALSVGVLELFFATVTWVLATCCHSSKPCPALVNAMTCLCSWNRVPKKVREARPRHRCHLAPISVVRFFVATAFVFCTKYQAAQLLRRGGRLAKALAHERLANESEKSGHGLRGTWPCVSASHFALA